MREKRRRHRSEENRKSNRDRLRNRQRINWEIREMERNERWRESIERTRDGDDREMERNKNDFGREVDEERDTLSWGRIRECHVCVPYQTQTTQFKHRSSLFFSFFIYFSPLFLKVSGFSTPYGAALTIFRQCKGKKKKTDSFIWLLQSPKKN